MAKKRRAFSAVFKAKVALDAIRGLKTSAELAKTHAVHSTQIALRTQSSLGKPRVFGEIVCQPSRANVHDRSHELAHDLRYI